MLNSALSLRPPAAGSALPNFFLVGAPKAGTTSLYYYLAQHPDVYMSPVKEPNYFAAEIRLGNIGTLWQDWAQTAAADLQRYLDGPMREKRFGGIVATWPDYLKLFQNVNGQKAIGEASVCYLWSRTAARNIAAIAPGAKIIMVLRNPVERAFSQYNQAVAAGLVGISFRGQVRRSLSHKSDKFELLNPFLEFGLYHDQVKRFVELFPAENLRIYLYEEYRQSPAQILADIFRFLAVDPQFLPDLSEKYLEPSVPRWIWVSHMLKTYRIWSGLKNAVPARLLPRLRKWVFRDRQQVALEGADRAYLCDYYRQDVTRLSTLIGRDLRAWLS
jgi:hypothetical protein